MKGWREVGKRLVAWQATRMRRRQSARTLKTAYVHFAQEQPEWAASLFDEHFLRTRLLPLLVRGVDLQTMDPELIADAWQAQLYPAAQAPLCTRAMLLCAAERYLQLVKEKPCIRCKLK